MSGGKFKRILASIIGCTASILVIVFVLSFYRVDVSVGAGQPTSQQSFDAEMKDSLEGICIGASPIVTGWVPTIAYERMGICVSDYSFSAMPPSSMKFYISEILKNQDPSVIVVDLTEFALPFEDKQTPYKLQFQPYTMNMHYALDYLPLSMGKLELTNELCEQAGTDFYSRVEYYLPFVRFHSRWQSLTSTDFGAASPDYKGAFCDKLQTKIADKGLNYTTGNEVATIEEENESSLRELFVYCQSLNRNFQFIFMPSSLNCSNSARCNYISQVAAEYGFQCTDFNRDNYYESIGLNVDADFRDVAHLNAGGAAKFSDYFGKLLVDKYGLKDQRGNPAYVSWDSAAQRYDSAMAGYFG